MYGTFSAAWSLPHADTSDFVALPAATFSASSARPGSTMVTVQRSSLPGTCDTASAS